MFNRKKRKLLAEAMEKDARFISNFEDRIEALRQHLSDKKLLKTIRNEEQTKHTLINPFLIALGFDVSNASLVRFEYLVKAKGRSRRVDYAFMNKDKPLVFVEAKKMSVKLGNEERNQLAWYFRYAPTAVVGVLTNGVEYEFYSKHYSNIMSGKGRAMNDRPFLKFSLLNGQIPIDLKHLTFDNFEPNNCRGYLEGLNESAVQCVLDVLSESSHPALLRGVREAAGISREFMSDEILMEAISRSVNRK